jgi:hypothetical protein
METLVWPLSEAEAVVLDRSPHSSEHETALEQNWPPAELEQQYGHGRE